MSVLNAILEFIFPSRCLSCQKAHTPLCEECLANIPRARRESEEWVFPLFDYRDKVIKRAVWMLKYKGKKTLVDTLGCSLYERILEELADLKVMKNFENPILVPIPLSPKRLRERGFNQALLLAQVINKESENTIHLITNVLIKIKETEHQARIKDRGRRLKNISGTFAVKNSDLIKNKNIILIDDVTTTGATLKEARLMLKEAGVRKVVAFTLAH